MDNKLQSAILSAIKTVLDATEKQVTYDVYQSVERKGFFKKDVIVKTNINITISDAIIDTKPERLV